MNQHIIDLKREIQKDKTLLQDTSRLRGVIYSIFSDNEYAGHMIVDALSLGIVDELQEKRSFQELSVVRYHLMLKGKYNLSETDADIALAYWADILDIDKSLLKNLPAAYESYGNKKKEPQQYKQKDSSNADLYEEIGRAGVTGKNDCTQSSKYTIEVDEHNKRKKSSLVIPLLLIVCAVGVVFYLNPSFLNFEKYRKPAKTTSTTTPTHFSVSSPKITNKPVQEVVNKTPSPTIRPLEKEEKQGTGGKTNASPAQSSQELKEQEQFNNSNNKEEGSRPANGTVLISFYQDGPIELTINNKSEHDYYVKLIDKYDITALTVYVYGESTVMIKAPVGTYTVEYSTGKEWIDEEKLFGESTKTVVAPEKSVFPFLEPVQSITLE